MFVIFKFSLALLLWLFAAETNAAAFKVGLVLDKAGKDDQSFNASAYRGGQRAEKSLGVVVKTVEVRDSAASESMMRALAGRKFDLVIAVGFSHAGAVKRVAPAFLDRRFVLIDSEVKQPNVTSVMFAEHEGSFLVGALAAMASKTGGVGFIGGMDIPLIRRFAVGYEAGIKLINPRAKIQSAYIGVTGDAFNNPPKAKELALLQNAQGADVIFHAAGSSGSGLFDAAEERNFLAIGVDSNQNGVKPGHILTSMVKSVDVAVFESIRSATEGKLIGGQTVFHGFRTGGIDIAMDENNKRLITPDMYNKAESIKAAINSGKIKVPDYYLLKK
ncbi:MAG: BMP family ABC transporter substrate-binding protein [bacterium]